MSYIDRSLGVGETVIARARFHWLYSLSAWLRLLFPAAVLAAVLIWANHQPDFLATDNPITWVALLAAIWLLLGLVAFLQMMMRKWTTEIGVTSHRFVEKYGAFSMRSNEIALPNIEGVRLNQSVLGRIFGYGTVRIEGTGVDSVSTPNIADPVGFVRAIQTAREHVAQRLGQAKAQSGP
jgi:uncharacterized membrane protein YdbT with pleckstrin-like domain